MSELKKLPIYKFQHDNSIAYNRISHSEVFGEDFTYIDYSKFIKLLGYQESAAIGYPKPGIEYAILFEFKNNQEYIGEFWCHVSGAFFKLNNLQITQ